MATLLLSLPTEILHIIAEFSCDHDENEALLHFRATCRRVQAATRRAWVFEYFTFRKLEFSVTKLTQLKNVAEVPEFANAVTSIDIRGQCSEELRKSENAQGFLYPTRTMFMMKYAPLLACALQNLRNLRDVQFLTLGEANEASEDDSFITFSDIFAMVTLALQACGLRPRSLSNEPSDRCGSTGDFRVNDLSIMPTLKDCFSELESVEWILPETTKRRQAQETATHFAIGLSQMMALTTLELSFQTRWSIVFFKDIVEFIYLPQLKNVTLGALDCSTEDLNCFLLKHSDSLRSLQLYSFELLDGAIRDLLILLRGSFHLTGLTFDNVCVPNGTVNFPGVVTTDGMINIKGSREINNVLAKVLERVRFRPFDK
ncbi:hypothetical protein LTR37_015353 [Vermiconidia calcicola]|uniref:Uncharacterized protein n=1 Tax=Vermiconidia calcicola TaxID=1690605 RepID=A0ACC3MS86_9PEZI|nr:hypothetical protein LTR37_015353 [Vermiconidia calcicola]